jgi:hypothetical protein
MTSFFQEFHFNLNVQNVSKKSNKKITSYLNFYINIYYFNNKKISKKYFLKFSGDFHSHAIDKYINYDFHEFIINHANSGFSSTNNPNVIA